MGNVNWKYDKNGTPTAVIFDMKGSKEMTAKVSNLTNDDIRKLNKDAPIGVINTAESFTRADGALDSVESMIVKTQMEAYLADFHIKGKLSDIRIQNDTPQKIQASTSQNFNRASGIEVENNALNFGNKLHIGLSGLSPEEAVKLESYVSQNPEFEKSLVTFATHIAKDGLLNAIERQDATNQTKFLLKEAGVTATVTGMAMGSPA